MTTTLKCSYWYCYRYCFWNNIKENKTEDFWVLSDYENSFSQYSICSKHHINYHLHYHTKFDQPTWASSGTKKHFTFKNITIAFGSTRISTTGVIITFKKVIKIWNWRNFLCILCKKTFISGVEFTWFIKANMC